MFGGTHLNLFHMLSSVPGEGRHGYLGTLTLNSWL